MTRRWSFGISFLAACVLLTACAVAAPTKEAGVVAEARLGSELIRSAAERTTAEPVLQFLQVSAVRDDDDTTAGVRQGIFDREAVVGRGELSAGGQALEPGQERLSEITNGEFVAGIGGDFVQLLSEQRVEASTYWWRSPTTTSNVRTWSGGDLGANSFDYYGATWEQAIDASHYLDAVINQGLIDGPEEVLPGTDLSVTLQVLFAGDVIAPLADHQVVRELSALGFSTTPGTVVPGRVEISSTGLITFVEIDMSPWWNEVFNGAGLGVSDREVPGLGSLEARYTLAIATVQEPLAADIPCGVDERETGSRPGVFDCVCPIVARDLQLDWPDDGRSSLTHQVLIVTSAISAGTTVQDLIDAPTVWLSARVVPDGSSCRTSIQTVAQLREMVGASVLQDIPPGVILDTRQFGS